MEQQTATTKRFISVHIDSELLDEFDALAKQTRRTRSNMLRLVMQQAIARAQEEE